jgi:hypothetical protein
MGQGQRTCIKITGATFTFAAIHDDGQLRAFGRSKA